VACAIVGSSAECEWQAGYCVVKKVQGAAMKLTLDTNCFINHFDLESATATSREEIAQLIKLATNGRAEIVITTRVEADLDQDKDDKRRAALKRNLAMFDVIASVLRWNESSWDGCDFWVDEKANALASEIQKVLFPGLSNEDKRYGNKIRDVDHIAAHVVAGRDIFITDDSHLNRRAAELRKLGAVVMRPSECVDYINEIDERKKPKNLRKSWSEEYHQRGLSGVVTFDYSNNNGRFAIGEGHFLFETCWSKASDVLIHAYSDPSSIDGIALVKEVNRIEAISDAATYDYSSRSRTPRIGEIVLWRNMNGLYAATKVLAIADDTRGAKRDELVFEFRILGEGRSFQPPDRS
jgi:hypothetical protein